MYINKIGFQNANEQVNVAADLLRSTKSTMFIPNGEKGSSLFPISVDRKRKLLTSPNPRSPRVSPMDKGKSKAVPLVENGADVEEAEVWKRFREAGLLDESDLRRKDTEALFDRIQELEKELHDYQYHMGLLLIEKMKWTSECEKTRQRLAEAEGIFKREQKTHMIGISGFRKREESIQKALSVTNQHAKDVEIQKLLHDHNFSLDSKKEEFNLDKKRNAFEEDLQEKLDALEKKKIEDQISIREHTLESKLEKLKDKEEEIDKKLRLLKEREESVHKEMQKLKDGVEQLAIDTQKLLTSKAELESSRTEINTVKQEIFRENENLKLVRLEVKQDTDACRIMKESLLKETEELIQEKSKFDGEREVMDVRRASPAIEQKHLNHDREVFNEWRCTEEGKLRSESLKMRADFQQEAEDFRLKKEALEKERSDFSHVLENRMHELNEMEVKVREKENEIEKEAEELRLKKETLEKERSDFSRVLESRMQELNEMEEKVREKENEIDREAEELIVKKEALEKERSEFSRVLESRMQELNEMEEKVREKENEIEREAEELRLKKEVLETERCDFSLVLESRMQELNEMTEKARDKAKEAEELILKKEALEKERSDFSRMLESRMQELNEMKEKVREKENEIEREAEELRLKKGVLEKERSDFSLVLESRTQELNEMKEKVRKKANEIEREKKMNHNLIKSNQLYDEANFPEEIPTKKRRLETDQFEMQNIDTVQKNFVDEHEEFIKERDPFLVVPEQCKICKNCGVGFSELDSSIRLQTPSRIVTENNIHLEEHMDGSQSTHLSGFMPFLQKCSGLINSSPRDIVAHPIQGESSRPTSLVVDPPEAKTDYGPDKADSEMGVGDNRVSERLHIDAGGPEAHLGIGDIIARKGEGKSNIFSDDVQDVGDEAESQSLSAMQRGGHQNRSNSSKTIKKIKSVSPAVEDANAIIGKSSEKKGQLTSVVPKDLVDINEGSRGDFSYGDQLELSADQKQDTCHAFGLTNNQLTSEDIEAFSDDVSVGGGRKKLQTSVPGTPTSGEKRYNFRLSTINRRARNYS